MALVTIVNEGAFDSTIRNQINANFSQLTSRDTPGTILSLGTLSAAATLSAMDASGNVTVTGANSLKAGQFIVLSNGGSAVGIFLNGVMVQVTSATASVYTFTFGQGKALTYASAADTLKYQVVQVNAGNQIQAQQQAAQITGVLATANLLTVTQANSFVAGQFVLLSGPFKTASQYAAGAIVQVASATATSWTANWQGTIIVLPDVEQKLSGLFAGNEQWRRADCFLSADSFSGCAHHQFAGSSGRRYARRPLDLDSRSGFPAGDADCRSECGNQLASGRHYRHGYYHQLDAGHHQGEWLVCNR